MSTTSSTAIEYNVAEWASGYQALLDEMTDEERAARPEMVRAYRTLLTFFQEHPMLTKQALLTFRDAFLKQGGEKRRPGGPYAGFDDLDMLLTEEGYVVAECNDLAQSMNVSNFI
jgi:hypothetical protein